jgi:spore germination cell wall hydrolase CwlJ-like protein
MKILLLMIALSAVRLSAQTYEQKVVAAVILGEAACQGSKGMVAVGEVIGERARLSGTSPLTVVTKPKAFSCLTGRKLDAFVRRKSREEGYGEALRIARTVTDTPQRLPGITRRATHFTRSDERPYWARGHRPVAVIGEHAFYRIGY